MYAFALYLLMLHTDAYVLYKHSDHAVFSHTVSYFALLGGKRVAGKLTVETEQGRDHSVLLFLDILKQLHWL